MRVHRCLYTLLLSSVIGVLLSFLDHEREIQLQIEGVAVELRTCVASDRIHFLHAFHNEVSNVFRCRLCSVHVFLSVLCLNGGLADSGADAVACIDATLTSKVLTSGHTMLRGTTQQTVTLVDVGACHVFRLCVIFQHACTQLFGLRFHHVPTTVWYCRVLRHIF